MVPLVIGASLSARTRKLAISARVTPPRGQKLVPPQPVVMPASKIPLMSGSWTEPSSSVKAPLIPARFGRDRHCQHGDQGKKEQRAFS